MVIHGYAGIQKGGSKAARYFIYAQDHNSLLLQATKYHEWIEQNASERCQAGFRAFP